jgi:hypothetical protein
LNTQKKQRKLGFIALMATGIIALAACPSPESPETAGQGRVRVSIGTNAAKTLMPAAPASFSKYVLKFTSSSWPTVTVEAPNPAVGGTIEVALDVGTWTLALTAYTTYTGAVTREYPAAYGTEPFTLDTGELKLVPISIAPIDDDNLPWLMDDSDNGIFKYTISYPATDVTGTMTLTGQDNISLPVGGTATGSIALAPGVYILSVTLKKNNEAETAYQPIAGTSAAVHIYPGLVTEAAGSDFTFTNANFVDVVYLAGTVDLTIYGGDMTVEEVKVAAYSDEACTAGIPGGVDTIPAPTVTLNASTAIPWFMAIPLSNAGSGFWLKVTITKGDIVVIQKFEQTAASIPRNGKGDFAFQLSVLGGWYVAQNGDDAGNGSKAAPYASVQKAVSVVHEAYPDGILPTGESVIINISGEITNAGVPSANGMVEINGNNYPSITLKGYDDGTYDAHSIKATGLSTRVLYIGGGADVTMENLTLTGGTADAGGGVYVTGNGSTFTMSGGTISGNQATNGGGVYVTDNSSTFTMSGGTISGNQATNGGGVYLNITNMSMTGGKISANSATSNGGGVYVYGTDKVFTFSGGVIGGEAADEGNTAATGGGVYTGDKHDATQYWPRLVMPKGSTGKIRFNRATGNGGGVYMEKAPRYDDGNGINGGEISDNEAQKGGGIYATFFRDVTVLAIRGGVIARNTATEKGGGVYVRSSFVFNLQGALNPQTGSISTASFTEGANAIIYGNGNADANTATEGQAVYAEQDNSNYRNSTIGMGGCLIAISPYLASMEFPQEFIDGWEGP